MKAKVMALALGAAALLAVGLAGAQSGPDVMKAKGCLNCHEMDRKKVGPAFRDVAAKYKADKGAEGDLIAKLKEGRNHPKITASDAELKAAVGHVLSTK